MIDFRYHLVSLVAVFLALGLGILLGSTALQPTVLSGLKQASKSEQRTINGLYATRNQLEHELAGNGQFAQAVEPQLLQQLLAGQRVVIVAAPGAPGQITTGIVSAVKDAGAVVSGQVHLQPTFLTPGSATQQQQLGQLAQQLAPAGVSLQPGTGQEQASQVLARVLLTKDGPGQPVAGQQDVTAANVLNGFGAGGYLTVSGQPDTRATLAVVVIPDTTSSGSGSHVNQALVTLARQLGLAGQGTVVAGARSGSADAIDALRSGGQAKHVSSVDDADTVIGQIVVVQALAEQLNGVTGNYGIGPNADAPGPSPAPTPSPTPSTPLGASATVTPSAHSSPSPTRSGKR